MVDCEMNFYHVMIIYLSHNLPSYDHIICLIDGRKGDLTALSHLTPM